MADRLRAGLWVLAVTVAGWAGCKDDAAKSSKTANVESTCAQLAKACADEDKHVDKVLSGCQEAAAKQREKGCAELAVKLYGCYERELCGTKDKVWALDDLRVLAERHGKCKPERDALAVCEAK